MSGQWVIALDAGATHISGGLVSSRGEIRLKQEIMTRPNDPEGPLKQRIVEFITRLHRQAGEQGIGPVAGVAAGVPGIVDTENGVLVVAGNIPELFGFPLAKEVEKALGLPVHVENDVNAQAVGELTFGAARGVSSFALFSIGTDLGGAMVVRGRVQRGAHNLAAEYGHITLDLDGERCNCGGQGCASRYVSGAGMAEKARAALSENSVLIRSLHGRREELTAQMVFEHAESGDAQAKEVVERFALRFGAVIANVMKVLDPEMVVLAGAIIKNWPAVIERIVEWTRHYYFPVPELPEFRVSELTKETAVLGPAAAFFVERGISPGWKRDHG